MAFSLWKEAFILTAFCIALPSFDTYGDLSLSFYHLSSTEHDCGEFIIMMSTYMYDDLKSKFLYVQT